MAKGKSTQSSILTPESTVVTSAPSSFTATTKIPSDKLYVVRLNCGHKIESNGRPNPRKKWPDPQMCMDCKKKMRVVEIDYPTVTTIRLTAPSAPKKYIKKLEKEVKKK